MVFTFSKSTWIKKHKLKKNAKIGSDTSFKILDMKASRNVVQLVAVCKVLFITLNLKILHF